MLMKRILLNLVGKRVDNRHNWVQGREKRAAVVRPTGDQHQEEKEEHRKLLSATLEGMPLKKKVRTSYVVVVKRKQTNNPQLSELPQTSSWTGSPWNTSTALFEFWTPITCPARKLVLPVHVPITRHHDNKQHSSAHLRSSSLFKFYFKHS